MQLPLQIRNAAPLSFANLLRTLVGISSSNVEFIYTKRYPYHQDARC
jgi:hypothetical protein